MTNTIIVGAAPMRVVDDEIANEAMSPGHVLQYKASAPKDQLVKQATANAVTRRAIALENSFGGGVNTAYAANDTVRYGVFAPGSVVNLRVASGASAIEKGDALGAHNDGTVKKYASGGLVGYALEALASPTSETFIKVELA